MFFTAAIIYHAIRKFLNFHNGLFFLLYMLCRNRVFYFLFYIELIKYELKIIEKESGDKSSSDRNETEIFSRRRFLWLREHYQTIYEIKEYVNSKFSWSNTATVMYSFNLVLTDVNWMYRVIRRRDTNYVVGK